MTIAFMPNKAKMKSLMLPGDIVDFVDESLIPDGVEGLGLSAGAVQLILVSVDRHVRVDRLVVCTHTHVNTYNTNTHFHKHATPISHTQYTQNRHNYHVNWHVLGTEEPSLQISVWSRVSPGFPKVMLCRFWKSVGRSPVASHTFTITVPLNMVNYRERAPPHDHFHTIDPLKIIDGASF